MVHRPVRGVRERTRRLRPGDREQPGDSVSSRGSASAPRRRGPREMACDRPVRGRWGSEGSRRAREHREIPRVGVLVARGQRGDGRPRRLWDGAGHARRTEDARDEAVPGRPGLEQSRPRAHRAPRPRPPEVVLRTGVRTMRRRSQLYVPANNRRMIAKAAVVEADSIVFDLEDAVPTQEKESARRCLGSTFRKADWGHRELGVRMNAPGTPDGERDLAVLAAEPMVSMLVVSKAESDLSPLGKATGKALIPIIETARGVLRIEDVVRSEGAVAVTYGAGDLATAVGGDVEVYGRNVYVKTRLVIAAAAYGLEAIDRVYCDLADDDGFRTEAVEAKRLGYVGKQVVHPNQVRLANEIFSPTEDEIRWARQVVQAYEDAARQGRGAIRVRDRLVDAVHYRGAKKTLERAGL